MSGQISSLSSLAIAADLELAKVVDIAGHVGDISGDDVNVSYTSLLIGLLWSDDPTSQWLQTQVQQHSVRIDEIYSHRNHPERSRDVILRRVFSGTEYLPRKDVISVSARTVLQEADSISRETHLAPNGPIGTRHLAAAYFFRNPPGHDRQLHIEWGFETETWRRAFAEFIGRQYATEAGEWKQLLTGYVATEPVQTAMPGAVLGTYTFDPAAIRVLRTVELAAMAASSTVLSSEQLLNTIVAVHSEPDCASFAELVAKRLGITTIVPLVKDAASFEAQGTKLSASRGFKNILDRARTLTRSITASERVGVRHIIASMLVAPDSTANRKLVSAEVSLPLLRQKLLKDFSRRWVNDDGIQWRFHLIGLTPPTVAGFNTDDADRGEDKLDVARYATAFAVVLAADKVTPPLSIGIFGDWGSGKSFFMRLMQEQTQKVVSSGAIDPDGKPLFCRRVVSIRFNAWYYADRNLWATLVQAIFQSLRSAMVGDQEDSDLMDRVIAKLEVTKGARKDAEERVRKAKAAEKASEERLAEMRDDLARKAGEIATVKTKDVIAALRHAVATDVQLEEAVTVAETYLGFKGTKTLVTNEGRTTGQIIDFVNESRIVAARSRSTLDWLVRAPLKGVELITLVGTTVLVLAAGSFLAIRYRTEINAAWPLVSAAFVEGGTIVALVTAWARRHLATISKGLDQFDTVRAQLDARVASQRADANREVEQAEAAHRAVVEALAQAQTELDLAQQGVRSAEREVLESRSAHRIAQLVEQRITGKQYERYLGIVDAIRKDFQTLTDLMKQLRREGQTEPADGMLPIDRIVLYIDDLDRCPSNNVVSVLEAIHLLLAFELFVVVVGVDVRWAASSLTERYPRHLSTGKYEGTNKQADAEEGASALDYLEKIFQIPFWLPPMDEQASRNMIAELVPRPKGGSGLGRENDAQGASSANPAPTGDTTRAQATRAVDQAAVVTPTNAEPLMIETEERNFMLGLADAVGKSPRRLKRFVNTYRILKGSIDALARETFVVDGGQRGEYRAAMTLLALVTGAPRSSVALLQQLAEQNDDEPFDTFSGKVPALAARDEASYVQAALQAYRTATANSALTLRELRHWMPQVTRFSFRSGSW
jgi:hypothetical protein